MNVNRVDSISRTVAVVVIGGVGGLLGYTLTTGVEQQRLMLAPKAALEATLIGTDKNKNGKLDFFEVLDKFADKNSRQITPEALQKVTDIARQYSATATQMSEISRSILEAVETIKKQQLQK